MHVNCIYFDVCTDRFCYSAFTFYPPANAVAVIFFLTVPLGT
jgi:hypothetical protein